jgi:hypothetical protein
MDKIKHAIQEWEQNPSKLRTLIESGAPINKKHVSYAISYEEPEAVEYLITMGNVIPDGADIENALLSVGTTADNLLERMLIVLLKGGAPVSELEIFKKEYFLQLPAPVLKYMRDIHNLKQP